MDVKGISGQIAQRMQRKLTTGRRLMRESSEWTPRKQFLTTTSLQVRFL
ncbi:hypothetical protein HanPSC8_Chr09g0359241 [Helianthus annuus]|nr:hypothetical protein HanPSC8_Chr09g0359241 [Helianthus annuus]